MKCFFIQDNRSRELFSEFMTEMKHSPRLDCDGLKVYRWAKREGDWNLSLVYLDKLPQEAARW